MFRAIGFYRRNGMFNLRYGRLLWRYLWRRFLTPAGWRWKTDGPVFFGKDLQLQIAKGAEIRFGRFSWIGDGTKIRSHEGVVEIGAKTVFGQECTISSYRHVRIGEQCVIADRAMFIDFDHGVVEVERPIRQQGIYMRECVIGSNVWVGYGACFLRGVTGRRQRDSRHELGRHAGCPGQRRGRRRSGEVDPHAGGTEDVEVAGPGRTGA